MYTYSHINIGNSFQKDGLISVSGSFKKNSKLLSSSSDQDLNIFSLRDLSINHNRNRNDTCPPNFHTNYGFIKSNLSQNDDARTVGLTAQSSSIGNIYIYTYVYIYIYI
jgi:hypothetical protein